MQHNNDAYTRRGNALTPSTTRLMPHSIFLGATADGPSKTLINLTRHCKACLIVDRLCKVHTYTQATKALDCRRTAPVQTDRQRTSAQQSSRTCGRYGQWLLKLVPMRAQKRWHQRGTRRAGMSWPMLQRLRHAVSNTNATSHPSTNLERDTTRPSVLCSDRDAPERCVNIGLQTICACAHLENCWPQTPALKSHGGSPMSSTCLHITAANASSVS